MRPDVVVIVAQGFRGAPRLEDRGEGVKVEQLVANSPVERFDVRVPGRLARRDEMRSSTCGTNAH
jgi:hypothetical protein